MGKKIRAYIVSVSLYLQSLDWHRLSIVIDSIYYMEMESGDTWTFRSFVLFSEIF